MKRIIGVAALAVLVSCSPVKKALLVKKDQPVYEIAIRKVIAGKKDAFVTTRTAFISKLTSLKGVSNDREFQSFYSLPKPDDQEVYIGMTQYENYKTPKKVQSKLSVVSRFMKFKKNMNLKAYVFAQPIEGGTFDLSSLASKPGQIVEIAIQRVKPGMEARFHSTRKEFVSWLSKQEGVVGSWEFKVVGGKDIDRLTVGISVYESNTTFQNISQEAQRLREAVAYFSTFDPIALQYASSIKN